MKIRYKLLLAFTAMVGLLFGMGLINYKYSQSTTSAYREMLSDSDIRYAMKAVQFRLAGMSNDERAYLLNGDPQFAAGIAEKHQDVISLFERIRQNSSMDPADHSRLVQVEEKYLAFHKTSEKVLALIKSGNKRDAEALHFSEERTVRKELDSVVAEFLEKIEQEIAEDQIGRDAANSRDTGINLAIFVGSILAAAAIGLLLARSITGPLGMINHQLKEIAEGNGDLSQDITVRSKDEVAEVAASYNRMVGKLRTILTLARETAIQVAASSEQLTASTEQTTRATEHIVVSTQTIAASSELEQQHVEETVQAMQEMSGGIGRVAAGNDSVSRLARTAQTASSEGSDAVRAVLEEMNEIDAAVDQTAAAIHSLADRSQHINGITAVISDLAGRTNILSLNASIEAARAGEQGRGFAVVAQEIRKLAEQSSQSARQISELIESVAHLTEQAAAAMRAGTEKVKTGLAKAKQVDRVFGVIEAQVADVTQHAVHSASTTAELAETGRRIVAMVEGIAEASNEVASACQSNSAATEEQLATMEEISASSQALSRMAEELHDVLSRFKLE